ncbi:MAG TPA: alpha/beta hydrolase, partial [Anaerolineales bacterium]|nr:alpha/beta hydrolase [Anaerolineales bacterium]
TLFLRAAETDTFWEKAANLIKRKQPKAQVETVEKSTHLLPLEHPKKVFDILQSFFNETLKVFVHPRSKTKGEDH